MRMASDKMIRISETTKEFLKRKGKKGESYDEIIQRLTKKQ